ncbi:MAG: calcium-binding protein [Rhizobiaceae bacterium]
MTLTKRLHRRLFDSLAALLAVGLATLLDNDASAQDVGATAREKPGSAPDPAAPTDGTDPETTGAVSELDAALREFDRLIDGALAGAVAGGGAISPVDPGPVIRLTNPGEVISANLSFERPAEAGVSAPASPVGLAVPDLAGMPIRGTAGADILSGTRGSDHIIAYAGDDMIAGGKGADRIDGGDGIDIVSYVDSDAAVFVSLALGTARGGDAEGDALSGIDGLFGSSFADMLEGNDGANVVSGHAGDDILIGGGGDDWLIGGAGADVLSGGDGIDTAEYRGGGPVTIDLRDPGNNQGDAAGDTYVSVERFYLSDGDDQFTGADVAVHVNGEYGNDIIVGSSAADTLVGGAGNDTLSGGDGDDWFDGGSGSDLIDGGDGFDTLDYRASNDPILFSILGPGAGAAGGDRIVSVERILGTELGDTFHMAGADGIAVELNGGDDVCFGGDGVDLVSGGAGNDWIAGAGGDDVLLGGAGDDFLWGGEGHDQLTGGAGDDRFYFDQGGTAFTRVTDFSNGDVIVVDPTVFSDFDAIAGAMWMEGDTTFIANTNGGWLALHGVDMASLNASDFAFDAIM